MRLERRRDLLANNTLKNLKNATLYVTLPDGKTRRASFYLAMEEYVARHAPAGAVAADGVAHACEKALERALKSHRLMNQWFLSVVP